MLLFVAGGFALFAIYAYLERSDSGHTVLFCTVGVVFAARWRWELSDRVWFWPAIVAISVAHLIFAWFVPAGHHWIPPAAWTMLVLVDMWAISTILSVFDYYS